MGNKHSHDESDGDDRSHLGTLRDFLKAKSPVVSPSSKRNNKEDAGDHGHTLSISNNPSNLGDKETVNKQASIDSSYAESGGASGSKPDGITKLAKVSCEHFLNIFLPVCLNLCCFSFIEGAYNSITESRHQGWDISQHILCMVLHKILALQNKCLSYIFLYSAIEICLPWLCLFGSGTVQRFL